MDIYAKIDIIIKPNQKLACAITNSFYPSSNNVGESERISSNFFHL